VKDSYKFIALFAATLALVATLVIFGHRKELQSAAGERVDIKKVEALVEQGKLSIHPAEFSKEVDSPSEEESE
jgi:hypothetical protein